VPHWPFEDQLTGHRRASLFIFYIAAILSTVATCLLQFSFCLGVGHTRHHNNPVEFRAISAFLEVPMKTRLRVLRAEKEWSQAELAAQVGVARGTINAIETGKYDPSLPLAFKIARVFGKTVEEVFLYQESEPTASANLDA